MNRSGVLVKRSGNQAGVAKNPAMQLVRDQAALIAQLAERFGMTPAARAAWEDADDGTADASWLIAVPS